MRPSTMRVRMRLFGPLREIAGFPEQSIELAEGDSVGDLLAVVRAAGTVPGKMLDASAVAVNQEYVQPAHVLQDGDEVAILPPVSGGRR